MDLSSEHSDSSSSDEIEVMSMVKKEKSASSEEDIAGGDDFSSESDESSSIEDEIIGSSTSCKNTAHEMFVVVKPENYKTSNYMSLYEASQIISARIKQIEAYNNCIIPASTFTTAREQARAELVAKKCPLTICRVVGVMNDTTYIEKWDPNVMVLPEKIYEA